MGLTKKQRKQIKQKIKTSSLKEVANQLNLSPQEVRTYLKKIWRKEKYQKLVVKEKEPVKNHISSSFKQWLKKNRKIILLLTFLVLGVYVNSLGNDFVSDDIATIKENPFIKSISYFSHHLSSRSLIVFITHKLFGLKPAFYRLSNILFHLGSTWLIFLLIGFFFQKPIPLITASLFAVHPILTESITWISGGPYSNSTFFILLSFLAYLWLKKKKKSLLFSIFFFLLALSFSEKVVVFPLVLFLYELCFGQLKKNWSKLIPFFVSSGFWMFYLVGLLGPRATSLEIAYSQASGFFNPFIQIPIAISSYLELIFWPKNLTLYHSEMSFSLGEYWLRFGILILFLGAMLYYLKKDRCLFFWLSFFLISLLPTLTPLKIAWIVAERYVYLGSLGIFVFIAFLIQKIGKEKKIIYTFLAVILLLLSVRTITRNTDWKNQDVLWLATDKVSPSSSQNHNNLGDFYMRQGNPEKAIEEFKRAIELNPQYANAHHNLGNVYRETEQFTQAIESYQAALSFNPNLWQSHQNLAHIFFKQGKLELAKKELEKVIEINPQNQPAKEMLLLIK